MGASPVVFAWSHGAANGNQLGRCGPSTDEVAVQWKTGQAGQELHRYTGLQYPRSDEEVAVMLGARLIGVTAKHPEGKTPDEVKRMQCNHRERDWSEVVTSRRMPTTTRLSKRQKNRSSLRPPEQLMKPSSSSLLYIPFQLFSKSSQLYLQDMCLQVLL
ncbi:uncharacterized protein [Physeter macrocephalus]|uniref:Uncharacterized protein isoform X3 n=1 Tax=Physeter macrocephalus TaxID=9755 RepID=A0A455C9T0_PHYMC|nr:uncharacterized protein LOC114487490 isoform X3 [Physeter catodon]|eukprot:XP_028353541.1 uncharacterized protein LOC114487490 isoform X2 [Physeter catodon]